MDLSNNQTVNLLNQIIIDYNDNINYYNSNMRHLINSLTRIVDAEYTHHSNYGSNISDHSSMFNRRRSLSSQNPPQFQQRLTPQPVYNNLGYQIFPWFSQRRTFQDVVVRPTQEQIDTACEYYTYEESMAENTCPISLVPFRAGDEICRIRHCNHSFRRYYILEWFRYNVRCPVCRYDIREYLDLSNNNIENNYSSDGSTGTESGSIPPSSTSARLDSPPNTRRNYNPYRSENTTNTTNNRDSNVFQRFGSSLETFLTQELNNMNLNESVSELLYSFDIPINIPSTRENNNNNNDNNNNNNSSSSSYTNVSAATTSREPIVEYGSSDEEKNNDSEFVIEDIVDISNNYS